MPAEPEHLLPIPSRQVHNTKRDTLHGKQLHKPPLHRRTRPTGLEEPSSPRKHKAQAPTTNMEPGASVELAA